MEWNEKPCPDCNGRGRQDTYNPLSNTTYDIYIGCQTCGRTGRVVNQHEATETVRNILMRAEDR